MLNQERKGGEMGISTKDFFKSVKLPDIQDTLPEVFIIESLNTGDEESKIYEGQMLCEMLRLCGKTPKYIYIQSKEELRFAIGLFRQSKYRYLHFSCHANETKIGFTNDSMGYKEFANEFSGHLNLRRLFFSACKIGNDDFLNEICATNKGLHSVVAPTHAIDYDHAAAIWSTLYLSLFDSRFTSMSHRRIKERLLLLSQLFPVEFFWATFDSTKVKWSTQNISKLSSQSKHKTTKNKSRSAS